MSVSGERQFLDTNILVYAHDKSAGEKHTRAKRLVAGFWETRCGCLSVQVLQEFYVIVTQKVSRPLAPEEASRVIFSLSHWHVHTPLAADILKAVKIQQRYQLSFWDAMIIRSAQALGCGVLLTEDLNPGQVYEEVKVSNPFF